MDRNSLFIQLCMRFLFRCVSAFISSVSPALFLSISLQAVKQLSARLGMHTDDDDFRTDRDEEEQAMSNDADDLLHNDLHDTTKNNNHGGDASSGSAMRARLSRKQQQQQQQQQQQAVPLVGAWNSRRFFPMEEINWSFRCMVRGISNLTVGRSVRPSVRLSVRPSVRPSV